MISKMKESDAIELGLKFFTKMAALTAAEKRKRDRRISKYVNKVGVVVIRISRGLEDWDREEAVFVIPHDEDLS